MSIETFTQMLSTYQVDTSKFGKGFAKSLERFYKDVVKERRSFLVVDGHKLHRIVELVRIFLRFRGDDGGIRELRIKSQGGAEGAERVRNQPLAMVLSEKTQGKWREAIQQCFSEKFDLQPSSQKINFLIDEDAYSYSEEVGTESATIPGIPTTYKTHSVIVMVKDKLAKDVQRLGLPKGKDFSTTVQSAGSDEVVKRHWTWVPATDDREAELVTLLQQHGVDVSDWPWMAFAELYAELYERAQSTLEVRHGELTRTISIIKVNIHADILCVNHELVVRAKKQKGSVSSEKAKHLSMRTLPDQSWEDGMLEALHVKLGISADEQREAMHVDHSTYKQTEEIAYSHTFPGLKTVYVVNEITARIMNPKDPRWMFIGLPKGTDFNFSRRDVISKSGETDIVSTQWGWQLAEQSVAAAGVNVDLSRLSHTDVVQKNDQEIPNLSRVEMPKPIKLKSEDIAGELVVARLMKGLSTDWKLGRRAAERILDRSYGLKQYYADILAAFPELRLYCVEKDDQNDQAGDAGGLTVAGRTTHDEYQRTIGALFAFFWLMRTNLNGKESFSLGMMENSSKDWVVKVWNSEDPIYVKRKAFLDGQHWDRLHQLLKSAGMFADESGTKANTERVLAFLCLMTIHDVMKIDLLQPGIPQDKQGFGGYKPGDTIMDHDLALSYVLERYPGSLPSYIGLAKEGRDAVKFAHSKLDYNMGWLVQGEAPPGLLFRSFREVVVEGKAPATDIAFYFVHWFCDLAGAEPVPLQGCDKFVLKFPQKVLKSFLDSFQFVWTLSREKTETMVLEEYFAWRWTLEANLGPPPTGLGSIAMMRLVLMAQGDSAEVVSSFQKLGKEDKDTLAFELNLTGRRDQFFGREEHREGVGPAVLIYYSPALMQKAGRKDARGAMQILAELFRQARELWPLTHDPQDVDRTVILRIDAIKDLEVPQLKNPEPGRGFVLKKNNEVDGMVRVVPIAEFQGIDWKVHTALIFGQSVVGAAGKNMKGNALAALGKRFSQYVFRGRTPSRTG